MVMTSPAVSPVDTPVAFRVKEFAVIASIV